MKNTNPYLSRKEAGVKNPNPLLSRQEAAEYLHVSIKFLEKHALSGDGPPFIKIGRLARYRQSDLEAYIQHRKCSNTSQGKHLGFAA